MDESVNNVATPSPKQALSWSNAGSEPRDLYSLMLDLYWSAVHGEIVELIQVLQAWDVEEHAQLLDEYSRNFSLLQPPVTGLGSFLARATGKSGVEMQQHLRATMRKNQYKSAKMKNSRSETVARGLLQAAAFLDIDKLIEYRPPLEDYNLWCRPRAPQLRATFSSSGTPEFHPMHCTSCGATVRGTYFHDRSGSDPNEGSRSVNPVCESTGSNDQIGVNMLHSPGTLLCETCGRRSAHLAEHLRKIEKHCALDELERAVPKELCQCGITSPFFPIPLDELEKHSADCKLLDIKREHISVRLTDLLRHKQSSATMATSNKRPSTNRIFLPLAKPVVRTLGGNIPFGNVHMALRLGPLIIENGVPNSNAGVLISTRQSALTATKSSHKQGKPQEVLSLGADRVVYQAKSPPRNRRLKACMKQVVGGVFCGISNPDLEAAIVQSLASAAKVCTYNPMKTQSYNDKMLERAATHIVEMLRMLLQPRVTRYLWALVNKLFDPKVKLRWHIHANHCQKFCASILDYNLFGSFFATECGCRDRPVEDPLYLVSFVCPPEAYGMPVRVRPRSKRVAPNGLTEEYLFRFYQYGHHNESDILDTLLEYWKDWAAMVNPFLYCQDLFPWDCTEACQMGAENNTAGVKCGECTIVQHIWAFPFDSWSMIQLHLFRERRFYSSRDNATGLSEASWVKNRLDVLEALGALNHIAAAMMNTKEIRGACRWHHSVIKPRSKASGKRFKLKRSQNGHALRSRPKFESFLRLKPKRKLDPHFCRAREKLSGIFRAQPESHFFEQGKYHDCTLAPWADLAQEDRIRLYLHRRNYRADKLTDIQELEKESRDRATFPDPSGPYPGGRPDLSAAACALLVQPEARPETQADEGAITHTTEAQIVPSTVDTEIHRWYDDSNFRTREYVKRVLSITWSASEDDEHDNMPTYDEWEILASLKKIPDFLPCPLHICSKCATAMIEDSLFEPLCLLCSYTQLSQTHANGPRPRKKRPRQIKFQSVPLTQSEPQVMPSEPQVTRTSYTRTNHYQPVYAPVIAHTQAVTPRRPMLLMIEEPITL